MVPALAYRLDGWSSKRTDIRWHIGVTLRAVIIAPERDQDFGMIVRIANRRRTSIVHLVCGLVGIPERGCHFGVGTTVRVSAEFLLQGVIDRARIRFVAADGV